MFLKSNMSSLVNCIVFVFILCFMIEVSREDNANFFFKKFRPEVFYDNKVLPEDAEVRVFVFRDEVKKVFFLVEREHSPLSLTITPCSAPIQWKLSLRHFPVSGNQQGKDIQQNEITSGDVAPSYSVLQATYFGQEQRTYTNLNSYAGLYMLEMDSHGNDTSVKIFVSTKPEVHFPHPLLPSNPRVGILKVRRNRVLITWMISPTESEHNQVVEYCVSANLRKSYKTQCEVDADINGDIPPTPPPWAGFGFWWEKLARKKLLMKVRGIKKSVTVLDDIIYECVGRKTWHMFRDLQEGTTYFFDVFSVNPVTNASIAYLGASTTTKVSKSGRIRDHSLTTLKLEESDDFSSVSSYTLRQKTPVLYFFVRSCTGPGPVDFEVSLNRNVLLNTRVMSTETLSINDALNGTYTFTVSSLVRQTREVQLFVSRRYWKFPFPDLPKDKRILVFDSLTTCDSVMLAWRASSDDKVRYCIYQSNDTRNLMPLFTCEPKYEHGYNREEVMCRRYNRYSRHRIQDLIMQKVKGLNPGNSYVFEVHVTKARGNTLPYEQVLATTRKHCTSYRRNR
ncbi:neuron derived neurotrophic factor nord isoform X2 [Tachypleus tridentatus]|uniref:neuron derived neurotrophic factor nord isoform X2 n=1 Tax=Tachypleus tridentatus TaxID=6853 RepID=UPI003FD20CE1